MIDSFGDNKTVLSYVYCELVWMDNIMYRFPEIIASNLMIDEQILFINVFDGKKIPYHGKVSQNIYAISCGKTPSFLPLD